MPRTRLAFALLALAAPIAAAAQAPAPPKLPAKLSLEDALAIFRAHGLDLMIAEAAVESAEGDARIARQVYNPNVAYSFSHIFNYDPNQTCPVDPATGLGGPGTCSPNVHSLSLGDNAAIEDVLSGKRGLRIAVTQAALRAARMGRIDAQRNLEFQVKQAYIQAVQARDNLDFALEVQKAYGQTYQLTQLRYDKGAISEADAAKVETAKLEADQALTAAEQALQAAKVSLAFLLGVREALPPFEVDQDLPKFVVPTPLATATPDSLLVEAYETRPDLKAQKAQEERATAAVRQALRARFPDLNLELGFTYAATGGGPFSSNTVPPTLIVGVSGNVPLFYQQQGEIRKAEADLRTQFAQYAKIRAQVLSDLNTALANFRASRELVERMESRLLDRARKARDLIFIQYQKGAASLLEYLDAQRTYVAATVEYLQDLTNYWTAVFQLEQAVGTDLRK